MIFRGGSFFFGQSGGSGPLQSMDICLLVPLHLMGTPGQSRLLKIVGMVQTASPTGTQVECLSITHVVRRNGGFQGKEPFWRPLIQPSAAPRDI